MNSLEKVERSLAIAKEGESYLVDAINKDKKELVNDLSCMSAHLSTGTQLDRSIIKDIRTKLIAIILSK